MVHLITTMNNPCLHFEFNEAWVMKSDDESQTRIRGAAGLRESGLQAIQGVPSDVIGQR